MTRRRWVLRQGQAGRRERAAKLAEEMELPPFAALLALGRGLEEEELPGFLGLEEEPLGDPFALPDMDLAAERIALALERGERVTVFGDYDADGVTATALLYHFLAEKSPETDYYLPDRHKEGYGLNMEAVDALAARGTKLIVTVDNGISAVREIAHARALGMEVVVTDHHQIGGELPQCAAVVNPQRADCELPFREYTGVGVAFLLACALEGCEPEELLPAYAELAALGTVADVAPLLGPNRAFARAGLEVLNEKPSVGFAALLRAARYTKRPLGASVLSFTLGPRVNAAGRMGLAEEALQLLLCADEAQAERLAQQLELYNEERQQTERDIMAQAMAWLETHPERQLDRVPVFAGEGWHDGVIGIAASRLTERLGRPCIMVTTDGAAAKGSGRSLPGFHLFQAVHACAHLLQKYGGHALAAGFSLPAADVERFREEINAYAAGQGEMPFPQQNIEAKLNPARLTPELADEIALLEPFGPENPQPVFALQKMKLLAATPVSENRHVRLTLEQGEQRVTAMAFHTAREDLDFLPGDELDLAVTLDASEYMGQRGVTLIVKDAKFCALPGAALLRAQRLTETAQRREPLEPEQAARLAPVRGDGAEVFRALKKLGSPAPPERLFLLAGAREETAMAKLWLAAEILRELGVLGADARGRYAVAPAAGGKADWDTAPLSRFLSACAGNTPSPACGGSSL